MIKAGGKVDCDSRELGVLVLGHPQTKPIALDEQPSRSVDVEALLLIPTPDPSSGIGLPIGGELTAVR